MGISILSKLGKVMSKEMGKVMGWNTHKRKRYLRKLMELLYTLLK